MKKILLLIGLIAAIGGTSIHAQSTNLAPVTLTIPPVARPIQQITPVKLDHAHSAAFLSAIQAIVALPANTVPVNGGYKMNADGTVTVFGTVQPTAPVTTQ